MPCEQQHLIIEYYMYNEAEDSSSNSSVNSSFSTINSEMYQAAEEIENSSFSNGFEADIITRCLICLDQVAIIETLNCDTCLRDFCINCAPSMEVSVIQCCEYHPNILWVCSVECRGVKNADTVRERYSYDASTCKY